MKTLVSIAGTALFGLLIFNHQSTKNSTELESKPNKIETPVEVETASTKIQVALLLDTSNSMDGLIDQAKSRLWNIVNTLTTLRYNSKMPQIEISLYEYGNDGLSAENGYIRQVTPLTHDLDLISEKLFALRTNGGSEFCGQVIQTSTNELSWDQDKNSMHLIYIAGNEPFDQGNINYKEAISTASAHDIFVNTIHCGDEQTGIAEFWKDGADKGKGEYFFIDHNQKIRYIPTPYDVRIDDCNTRLNQTYIYYGNEGEAKMERQYTQDMEAASISVENKVDRAAAKAAPIYNNSSWDLVDAVNNKEVEIKDLDKSTLPASYKNLSNKEIQQEIVRLNAERTKIQKEIQELSVKREEYIQNELAKSGDESQDLGKAITDAVVKFANAKGYTQEK